MTTQQRKALYNTMVHESYLRGQMENAFDAIGFSFEYSYGKIGEYLENTIQLQNMVIEHCLGLHLRQAQVYVSALGVNVNVDVFYPEDNNPDYCITMDDFSLSVFGSNNKEVIEAVWNAIIERDNEALKYIKEKTDIEIGFRNNSQHDEAAVTKHEIYDQLVATIKSRLAFENAMHEAGMECSLESGAVGEFLNAQNINFETILLMCLDMHIVSIDVTDVYKFLDAIDVVYPDDNDENYSLTEDDILHFIAYLDTEDISQQLWKAIVEKNDDMRQWINHNSSIWIGPSEVDNG